jgi:hypothetical protein
MEMSGFASDVFEPLKPLTPDEVLEQRRLELRNGLTDMQRLFLFGKLSGLNDKDAAIAAGYSVSVAENTKQRIRKPRVHAEFVRLQRGLRSRKRQAQEIKAPHGCATGGAGILLLVIAGRDSKWLRLHKSRPGIPLLPQQTASSGSTAITLRVTRLAAYSF